MCDVINRYQQHSTALWPVSVQSVAIPAYNLWPVFPGLNHLREKLVDMSEEEVQKIFRKIESWHEIEDESFLQRFA